MADPGAKQDNHLAQALLTPRGSQVDPRSPGTGHLCKFWAHGPPATGAGDSLKGECDGCIQSLSRTQPRPDQFLGQMSSLELGRGIGAPDPVWIGVTDTGRAG